MKRFHVHVHVSDLARSQAFYERLFGAKPAKVESDYAKWMLDDPPLNFAISQRGGPLGIDHVGFQTDDADDLLQLRARAEAADALSAETTVLDEGQTTCCYARSQKHWVTDPQGLAWEQFQTLADIPVFREAAAPAGPACCAPSPSGAPAPATATADAGAPRARCC
jgi:catechol 2,3-dioxygenase-like lactoylglutathione lyase family enzyme